MNEQDKGALDRFPDITPVSVMQSTMHIYELTELSCVDEVNAMLTLMYDHPERQYYLFMLKNASYNTVLKHVTDDGWLLSDKAEFYYYRIPTGTKNFTQLLRHQITTDDERALVESGPMYKRLTLELSKKAEREIATQIAERRRAEQNKNPLELKPGLWGLTIDVAKIWRWLIATFAKKNS